LIRQRIVDCYKGTGTETSLDEVAARLGLDRVAVLLQLRSERPLDDMAGLSIEEAKRVLTQFDGLSIFAENIEKVISDFDRTRGQIQEIERNARGDGPSGKK
jgi:hypothetical protein